MTEMTLGELLAKTGGSIKTGPFGTVLKAAEYSTGAGVPVISVGEIRHGRLEVRSDTPRVAEEVLSRLPDYVLRAGDVVFGRKGAVDRSAWLTNAEAGYFLGSDGIRVRFGPGVVSRFIAYQFQTGKLRDWLIKHAAGTTMASLNEPTLKQVPVVVPSLDEQQAIAGVLGGLDDKIAANELQLGLVDQLADAIFARAASFTTADPKTFVDIADVGGGGTPRTSANEFWGGDVQWATPTDITALTAPYLSATARTITDAGLAACSSSLYPAGSILMTSRATIGAFAIAQVPMAVNQGFIVANAKESDRQWWLFHDMRSRVDEFLSFANGATFLELPRGRFKSLPVRIPSDEVLQKFNERVSPLHALAAALVRENRKLAATRDELLPLLMSGKIRVRDAERQAEDVL